MMEDLSPLSVTSSVSNFPGVSSVACPPDVDTEYRWFHPSCSEEKTMRFFPANWKDPSSVSSGNESSSAAPLFQISCDESLAISYTRIDQGRGDCGIRGCFICLPT